MSSKVLVVDDKQMMRDSVGSTLQRAGYSVVVATDGNSALSMVAKHRPAAVITDLKMPEMDGLELLARLRQADDQLPVVLMTAYGSVNDAVAAMKKGAFDFIQKPFEGDQLVMVMRRAVEHSRLLRENAALRTVTAPQQGDTPVLVGKSPAMRQLAQQIHQIANSNGTVLICGESGTGKEVVSRTIHAHSTRRDSVMLAVNCAALSSNLLESELFGHEKGAFTGADQMRKGRFELADGGTLLLDEISEIGPELQAKLLRVLQEQSFERVGSSLTMKVDVRVIATTNRDLAAAVAAGDFRQDLYYRLNVLPIVLPPLRMRADDVPLLVDNFLLQLAMREGREPKRFDDESIELLKQYSWPGNVRELQNICERASVLSRGQVVKAGLIQPWLTMPEPTVLIQPAPMPAAPAKTNAQAIHAPQVSATANAVGGIRSLEEIEREQIIQTLGYFSGNRVRTAKALGIGVRTLGLKLKKWKELNLVAQTI
ncbi:MAG: sigma-54 dependent transcriptional regulator [Phycisphaerales bacterium]